jgi:hypothetical protein
MPYIDNKNNLLYIEAASPLEPGKTVKYFFLTKAQMNIIKPQNIKWH